MTTTDRNHKKRFRGLYQWGREGCRSWWVCKGTLLIWAGSTIILATLSCVLKVQLQLMFWHW